MRRAVYPGFITIFIMFGVCYGQLPKASAFLPLQIGNVWQHKHKLGTTIIQKEVVSDTLLGDTLIVYKILSKAFQNPPSEGFQYYYYSADSAVVYLQRETFPDPPYNLSSLPLLDTSGGFGGTWEVFLGDITATASITDTGTVSFFGERRKWLEVNLIEERGDSIVVLPGDNISFIEGIGISLQVNDTLIYAKIDGKEYGTPATSVRDVPHANPLPDDFNLQVYPNPARLQVTFFLENIPDDAAAITIYDILGRKVWSTELAGTNPAAMQIDWDGRDAKNQLVASGIYFVTVKTVNLLKTHKFIFLP